MATPPEAERLTVPGPAGDLEALLETPRASAPRAVAVVCHPHPLHGGTMQNKVAHTLARAFVNSGFAAIRFNFRGVGASAGSFDDGDGEVSDVAAVTEFVRERYPGLPSWLGGFSFGAAMAIVAATRSAPHGLVSIAPAAFRISESLPGEPQCPWLIVHADNDELIPIEESLAWVNDLQARPELIVLAGASHFFHGRLVELRKSVEAFVTRYATDR